MKFENIKCVYFLGIGGIGMSALARYFHHHGIRVMGYDKTRSELTDELNREQIQVHYEDLGEEISSLHLNKEETLVVITPAVPSDHKELHWFMENGFNLMKRSQVLGFISDEYQTIGVAGTHGKTTTSTLLAHIFQSSGIGCTAFLGGISTNYNTNLLLDHLKKENSKGWMVAEADEFDRSFLTLHPRISIITSTDADHLDIYGNHEAMQESFLAYAQQTSHTLFLKKETQLWEKMKHEKIKTNASVLSYSVKEEADVWADEIRLRGGEYRFDFHAGGTRISELLLGIPGLHNVENAVAASAAALEAGISESALREALVSFQGVKRRFEYIIKRKDMVYIDDYAHHPEELRAIISSVKEMYHDKKITVIFQPHLFSRTRDFVDGFAQSLSLADDILLLDIYPARELPIPGITSEVIFKKITAAHKMLCSLKDILDVVERKCPEVLLTLGAGDIDRLVAPLKKMLSVIKHTT